MSTWTHVCGSFRVDGLVFPGSPVCAKVSDIEKLLGPMCLFDKWDESSTLPRGSEGSLQYTVHQYGTGLPWVVVTVWGDLRDYSDVGAIRAWWDSIPAKLPYATFVRDGVLVAEVEDCVPVVMTMQKAEIEVQA